MSSISILILTLNEEANLPACLEGCAWCDDVVVFDSFSGDKTCEIAALKGARVFQRQFDDYAAQRNAALTTVSYKHPWVLMLDADERTPADLVAEMSQAVAAAAPEAAMFRMRRKDMFLGRWLRRSSGYPTWFGRLVRVGRVHVERAVNEEYVASGSVGYLRAHLVHYPFNKGLSYWLERHNRYSTMEAGALLAQRGAPLDGWALLGRDPIARRRALKRLAYRLPMRPSLVFLYWYIIRLGFLDGRAGYAFVRLRTTYELLIDLKVLEQRQRADPGAPV
jgi:glycosyltransferase involved in cell wall biosynthesis